MADAMVVNRSGTRLAEYVRAGDWEHADRELQYFVGSWLRNRPHGDESARIASLFDELRMFVVTEHDVDQTVGPAQFAWMLGTACSLLAQSVTPAEIDADGLDGKVLVALAEAEDLISTKDLAHRAKCSYAATARVLPALRAQGLTTGVSAGRYMLNGVTDAGRTKASEIRDELRVRRPITSARTGSLERRGRGELSPMHAGDVVKPLEPNDPHVVLRARA